MIIGSNPPLFQGEIVLPLSNSRMIYLPQVNQIKNEHQIWRATCQRFNDRKRYVCAPLIWSADSIPTQHILGCMMGTNLLGWMLLTAFLVSCFRFLCLEESVLLLLGIESEQIVPREMLRGPYYDRGPYLSGHTLYLAWKATLRGD